jgi:hypothetical protein
MNNAPLRVGIARRDITPPLGTRLFGYPSERIGNQIADGLNVTALSLQGDNCNAVLVSLDWAVIDEDEVVALRREVVAATDDVSPENITLCASHTHSGPETTLAWGWAKKNTEYLDAVRPRIVEAVLEAHQSAEPAKAGIGTTTTQTGINRREVTLEGNVILGFNPWGPRDNEMTIVRFEGEFKTIATLVHLGVHPTSRGGEPSISRDWPGVMMDRVEAITRAPVLFINGAFGDVAPRTNCRGAVGDGAAAAEEVGLRAASDAINTWYTIKEVRALPLQTHVETIELPHAPLDSLEEAKRQLAERAGQENESGSNGCEWNFWNAVQDAHNKPMQTSRAFQQIITRLGSIAIVPFGGEIFSEIALRLKRASPFAHTLCAGSSNGSHGYYVTRDARARGGYEPWVARAFSPYILDDNIDDVLVQENLRLLKKLAE